MLKKYRNQLLATNPATIEVPKKTKIKTKIMITNTAKNFIHKDLYMLGPKLCKKKYQEAASKSQEGARG